MRLALALVLATLFAACATVPKVEVVPHEPKIAGEDTAGWARACVRGPKDEPPPPESRPYETLTQKQRETLSRAETLAIATYGSEPAERKPQLDAWVAERGKQTLAGMREDRDAIGWRLDQIERRAKRKYGLRTVSPCYALLADVFHGMNSAIDFRAHHEDAGDVWPPPGGTP